MSSNMIDTLVDSIRMMLDDVGFTFSLFTIGVTLSVILLPFFLTFIFALAQKEKPLLPPAGCRKLGLSGKSNLWDQYSPAYSQAADPGPSNAWKVKALFIYPVKSCKGIELDKTEIIRTGLKYDRQFTFGQQVTGLPSLEGKVQSDWNVITLRSFPRLAKVETEIWAPDPKVEGYDEDGEWVKNEGCLIIRFPFTPDTDFSLQGLKAYGKILAAKLEGKSEPTVEFRLPFNPSKERIKHMKYRSEKIKIWKDNPEALDIGPEVPDDIMAKLKYTLGVTNPLSLFRIDTEKYREVKKNAPKKKDVGFETIIGMQDSVSPFYFITPRTHSAMTLRLFSGITNTNISVVSYAHHEPGLRSSRLLQAPQTLSTS